MSKELSRKAKFLVNSYIINDPLNPQNNGKVKVIRYGMQLAKIINSAIDGDDAEEFGQSIFDLSENGCNFRIKVETSSESRGDKWPSYVTSKFLSKSKIEGMTEEKMEEIYSATYDLDSLVTSIEPDEINKIIKEHFLLDNKTSSTKKVEKDEEADEEIEETEEVEEKEEIDEDDDLEMEDKPEKKMEAKESPDEIQKKIDDLLEGIK